MATKRTPKQTTRPGGGTKTKGGATPKAKGPKGKKPKGEHLMRQICPYRPDPTKFARYQVVQNGYEVGMVFCRGSDVTACTEYWQLYKTTAVGVPGGLNGFQRSYYIYPSYESRQTESPDVTTRFIFVSVATSVTPPTGLQAGTNYTTITALCKP
jgi:hypothetical protein